VQMITLRYTVIPAPCWRGSERVICFKWTIATPRAHRFQRFLKNWELGEQSCRHAFTGSCIRLQIVPKRFHDMIGCYPDVS